MSENVGPGFEFSPDQSSSARAHTHARTHTHTHTHWHTRTHTHTHTLSLLVWPQNLAEYPVPPSDDTKQVCASGRARQRPLYRSIGRWKSNKRRKNISGSLGPVNKYSPLHHNRYKLTLKHRIHCMVVGLGSAALVSAAVAVTRLRFSTFPPYRTVTQYRDLRYGRFRCFKFDSKCRY